MNIAPYQFMDAERLRFGQYPVLDTVLYRWTRRIEETLFEQAGVEVYAGASVFEEMKFAAYFSTLRRPRPIYFCELGPFPGTALFVVDNRFSAFCLRQPQGGAASRLTPENQGRLQEIVQALLRDFDACWADVHPVHTQLRKITTYPFRARILNPYETCLVAQIHLSGDNISARINWCLPRHMLEPVLPRLREARVLPPQSLPVTEDRADDAAVLGWLSYPVQVEVGRMSLATAADELAVGAVLPLQAEPDGAAVLSVEGQPLLKGEMGDVAGHYALKVEGAYAPPTQSPLPDPAQFRPLRWPDATTE